MTTLQSISYFHFIDDNSFSSVNPAGQNAYICQDRIFQNKFCGPITASYKSDNDVTFASFGCFSAEFLSKCLNIEKTEKRTAMRQEIVVLQAFDYVSTTFIQQLYNIYTTFIVH